MTKRSKYIIATAERKIKNYVCFTNLQAVQTYVGFAFCLSICPIFNLASKANVDTTLPKVACKSFRFSPVHYLCKQGKCVYTLANPARKTVPAFTVHYLCKQGEWIPTFAKTSFSNYADLQFVHNFSRRFFNACW